MSFSFLLQRNGVQPDYIIRRGRIVLSLPNDTVRDRIFTALSTQLGEWFLDYEDGVPYYPPGGILGGKMTEAEVSAILRRRILLDPDVDIVEAMSLTQDASRHVSVSAQVRLKTGESITVGV